MHMYTQITFTVGLVVFLSIFVGCCVRTCCSFENKDFLKSNVSKILQQASELAEKGRRA